MDQKVPMFEYKQRDSNTKFRPDPWCTYLGRLGMLRWASKAGGVLKWDQRHSSSVVEYFNCREAFVMVKHRAIQIKSLKIHMMVRKVWNQCSPAG